MEQTRHFKVLNPARPRVNGSYAVATGCGKRADAPVCRNAATDVTCQNEIYAGCGKGETDCANCATSNDNYDDVCCAGWSTGGVGDNIDHAACKMNDADYGGWSGGGIFCRITGFSDKPPLK